MGFAVDLSSLVEKAKGKTELAVRKVIIETFSKVVLKSPVDTGRFRANWVMQYGAPNVSTTDETDKAGGAAIGKIETEVVGVPIGGKSIFLTNSLAYSIKLENGYSQQAPAGMVRLTLAEITAHYGR